MKALLHGIYDGRERARNYNYSLLVADLKSAGVDNLGMLGRLLVEGDSAARAKEGERTRLSDAQFARLAIGASNARFRSVRPRHRKR